MNSQAPIISIKGNQTHQSFDCEGLSPIFWSADWNSNNSYHWVKISWFILFSLSSLAKLKQSLWSFSQISLPSFLLCETWQDTFFFCYVIERNCLVQIVKKNAFEGRCSGCKRSLIHFHAPSLNSRAPWTPPQWFFLNIP